MKTNFAISFFASFVALSSVLPVSISQLPPMPAAEKFSVLKDQETVVVRVSPGRCFSALGEVSPHDATRRHYTVVKVTDVPCPTNV